MAKKYRPLAVPAGVQVTAQPDKVLVKGKLGTLTVSVPSGMTVRADAAGLSVESGSGDDRVMVGTVRAHLRNAMAGVAAGYEKVIQVRGMGYRVQKTKDGVQIQCGFSHPIEVAAPAGVTFDISQVPNPDDTKQQMFEITIKGIDRHAVGQVAARMRLYKPPDPYLGKGIRYRDEYVKKKAGKRAVGTQA